MHFICCLSLKVFTTTRSFNVCLKNVNKLDIYSHHTMFHIYCNLYGKWITILTVAATLQKVIWICSNYSCRYFAASTLQQLHCSNLAGGSKNEVAASWLRQPSGNRLQQGCQNQLLQLWYFRKGKYTDLYDEVQIAVVSTAEFNSNWPTVSAGRMHKVKNN